MFNQKKLKVQIVEYNGLNQEVITWEWTDYPMDIVINKVITVAMDAHVKIYGLSKESMEQITVYQWKNLIIENKRDIYIFADDGYGEREIYSGTINVAKPVYEQPNIYIDIRASAGTFQNTMGEIPPSSIKGEVSVPDIFEKIAKDYGLSILNKNEVIDGQKYKNPYFSENGLRNRLKAAADAYNYDFVIKPDGVEIFPLSNKFYYVRHWDVSKEDYIGYPTFTDVGISLMFDEVFDVELDDKITVHDSGIETANDTWNVNQITYNLSTKIGGKWFMQVNGTWE